MAAVGVITISSLDGKRRAFVLAEDRLRITPTPLHSDADIDALVDALGEAWQSLNLRLAA
jgi:selenocysteine lyase/cysteine desulfurase